MTGFDYTRAKSTAQRLIKKFGQMATLHQTTSGGPSYDPTISTIGHDVKIAVLSYEDDEIDGSEVKRGDKRLYLSTEGLSVTPQVDDRMTIEGAVHDVLNIRALSPAGTVVFWMVQARA